MNSTAWAWTALVLYLAGLILAFGVRTWVQIRSTGTSGFRGISGRPGSLAWWGGVLFPVASLLALAAPVLVLTGTTTPFAPLVRPAVAVGVALMAPTLVALVALLAVVLLVGAVQIQVRVVEEPHLRRVHGDAYTRYASQAGRFLPGLGRISPHADDARTSSAG